MSVYMIWTDSESDVYIPDDVPQYYKDLQYACNVACDLAHEHDGKPYRAVFHVEDLECEETIETYENLTNG